MGIPVSHYEVYGQRPTEDQLSKLIQSFKTNPTFFSLSMWNLMLSLYEGNVEMWKWLQSFFINNLIRPTIREQVFRHAAIESENPRATFGRWQILALMKRLLFESSNGGEFDPRVNADARYAVGDACLMLNDLLFTDTQMARLENRVTTEERERIHDELMVQWLFQFELYRIPDVYQAIARNDEYFNIFEGRATTFVFANNQSLTKRFAELTGLELRQYLRLYFSVFVLHVQLQEKHPAEINANPSIINFAEEQIFASLDWSSEEKAVFFQRVLADLPKVTEGVKKDVSADLAWQFDFTTFRSFPLVYNSESKQGFTCVAFPFLIEKLASGIYHTILNSWAEGDPERERFQSYWGKVFAVCQ